MGKDVNKLQELINKLEQLVEENKSKNEANANEQTKDIENTITE